MATIRIRRNTAAAAASSNPVLAAGEPGYETDTGVLKIGDGTTAWNDLDGITGGGSSNFLGLHTSLANLEAAHATASTGNWAIVDPGSGTDAVKYLWDEDEGWVAGGSGGTGLFADLTDDPRDNAALEAELEALEAADNQKANLAIEIRSITGSHTLDATDASNFTSGKSMHIKGNGAGTLTIPLQSVQAMPAGYNVMYSGFTAVVEGNVSITTNPSSGSLTSSSTTAKYYLIRNAADDWDVENGGPAIPKVIQVAASDEITALTTGTGKITFRMPYAMTLTAVRASLTTAQTSGSVLTVDINDGGTTILSTKLTFDNGEKTTTTATTAAVISDTALADDAEIRIDISQVGDGTATGLKVSLIGN